VLITAHCYVADTVDGGLLPGLLDVRTHRDRDVPLFPAVHSENPMTPDAVRAMVDSSRSCPSPEAEEKLEV